MARSVGKPHGARTITHRMRTLRTAIGVKLAKLRMPRGQRPRSAVPRIGRKNGAKSDN